MHIPCCEKNQSKSKGFVNQFNHFMNRKILYITYRDTKYCVFFIKLTADEVDLISMKRKEHLSNCKIYLRLCSCKENYIDESKRNMARR